MKKLISFIILTQLCEKITFIFHILSFFELLGENDHSEKKCEKGFLLMQHVCQTYSFWTEKVVE